MLCPILWAGSVGWQDILALYGTSWDGKDWTNHFQDDFFILTHSWGAWCSLVSCLPGILPSTASPWGMGFSQHGNPSIDTLLQQLVPKKEMELTRSAKAHPELTVIPLYSVDNWVKRMGALYFRISEGGGGDGKLRVRDYSGHLWYLWQLWVSESYHLCFPTGDILFFLIYGPRDGTLQPHPQSQIVLFWGGVGGWT
jgi:hypothetical protein